MLFGALSAMTLGTPIMWWYSVKEQKRVIRRLEAAVDCSDPSSITSTATPQWIRASGPLSVKGGEPLEFQGKQYFRYSFEKAVGKVLEGDSLVLVKDGVWRTATFNRAMKPGDKLLLGHWIVDSSLYGRLERAKHDPMYMSAWSSAEVKVSNKEMARRLEEGIFRSGIPVKDGTTWTVYTYTSNDGVLKDSYPWTVVSPLSHEQTLSKHKNNLLAVHAFCATVTVAGAIASYVLLRKRWSNRD